MTSPASELILARLHGAAPEDDRPLAGPGRAPAGGAGPSRAAPAAGDPCRRHQRQGLARCAFLRAMLEAGGLRVACLHLARIWCASTSASGWPGALIAEDALAELPGAMSSAPTAARRSRSSRSPPRRRSWPSPSVPADLGAAGDRARRAARRDQCRGPAAAVRDHADLDGPQELPRRHAGRDRGREGRHPQARRARRDRAAAAGGDRGDRGARGRDRRAAACCRPRLGGARTGGGIAVDAGSRRLDLPRPGLAGRAPDRAMPGSRRWPRCSSQRPGCRCRRSARAERRRAGRPACNAWPAAR